MAQHAIIDAAGRLIGFYDDRIHKPLPPGAVELTPEQYGEWVEKQSLLVWDTATKTLVAAPAAIGK